MYKYRNQVFEKGNTILFNYFDRSPVDLKFRFQQTIGTKIL